MKVIIVGGVAGGASCAARLRRLDEKVEILMAERGPYVSYANCGLPCYVGGVIQKESSLLIASEQMLHGLFRIDVRVICRSAQRAYYATRILLQNGFKARNISGGMLARSQNYLSEEAAEG
jgi:rhodanese-related sulfurtransferase